MAEETDRISVDTIDIDMDSSTDITRFRSIDFNDSKQLSEFRSVLLNLIDSLSLYKKSKIYRQMGIDGGMNPIVLNESLCKFNLYYMLDAYSKNDMVMTRTYGYILEELIKSRMIFLGSLN